MVTIKLSWEWLWAILFIIGKSAGWITASWWWIITPFVITPALYFLAWLAIKAVRAAYRIGGGGPGW